jgi:hypothetical protein
MIDTTMDKSQPAPAAGAGRPLVWAPDEVRFHIEQQVVPPVSRLRRVLLTAIPAFVLTWPLTFLVFVVATLAAPSVTGGASVGTVALWALWFAALFATAAAIAALRLDASGTGEEAEPSRRATVRRLAIHALVTGLYAALVLTLYGLSPGQVAVLAVAIIVVLHVLPVPVARLLGRWLRRRQGGAADQG